MGRHLLLSALSKAEHCSPRLSKLKLDSAFDDELVISALSKALRSWVVLETLCLPSHLQLHLDVWQACCQLAALRNMQCTPSSVDTRARTLIVHSPPSTCLDRFPEPLETFVCAMRIERASRMVASVAPAALTTVALHIYGDPDQEEINTLIKSVCNNVPQIQTFAIMYSGGFNTHHFRPLHLFGQLRALRIMTRHSASLTDNDFEELAKSMPRLEMLSISPLPVLSLAPPPATIISLGHIARNCSKIIYVGLCLDASRERMPSVDHDLGVFSESLEILEFGLSHVDDALSVALPIVRMTLHQAPDILSSYQPWRTEQTPNDESVTARIRSAAEQWRAVSDAVAQIRPYARKAF